MIPAKYAQALTPARLRDIEAAAWWERDNADRNRAEAQVAAIIKANRVRELRPDMRDVEIKGAAKGRADAMRDHINDTSTRPDWWAWVGERVQELGGRPIDVQRLGVDERAGVLLRYKCADWWTRQLRRVVVAMREQAARELSEVCARRRQPYLTDDTVRRLLDRDAATRAMLEAAEIESAEGDVITLADAADASTANPAIRRGELMTRITGCERWADARGWLGLFTTHTTPSRFHATKHTGDANPAWTAAGCPTVREAQGWLCKTWAKCRAAMARRGLEVFGVRVAEPHQDGTPHWHMLVWCAPGQREQVVEVMREYWLKDAGDERGAAEHRFKAKSMIAGGAAGYVAKYISKGIDDAGDVGESGHVDDTPEGVSVRMEQADLFGGGAARVRMWARAHSIRQFQAIGQPPVTVWRELRRVPEVEAKQGPGVVVQMWDAVNREGERRACWASYMERQGGACIGRDYRVKVATEEREQVGRYETTTKARPVGVLDTRDKLAQVVRSSRKEWKPRGAWGARANSQEQRPVKPPSADGGRALAVHPCAPRGLCYVSSQSGGVKQGAQPRAAWTRANNCTRQPARNEDLRRRFAWAFADEAPETGANGPGGPTD